MGKLGIKLIYIEWDDAASRSHWFDKEALKEWVKTKGVFVKQVGWVVYEDKRIIVLASGIHEEDSYTEEQYLGLQKIPKGWIKKRKELK